MELNSFQNGIKMLVKDMVERNEGRASTAFYEVRRNTTLVVKSPMRSGTTTMLVYLAVKCSIFKIEKPRILFVTSNEIQRRYARQYAKDICHELNIELKDICQESGSFDMDAICNFVTKDEVVNLRGATFNIILSNVRNDTLQYENVYCEGNVQFIINLA